MSDQFVWAIVAVCCAITACVIGFFIWDAAVQATAACREIVPQVTEQALALSKCAGGR